jgi:hypothetical protein
MSQAAAGNQPTDGTDSGTERPILQPTGAKLSWGRDLALTGVAQFLVGLLMVGLLKNSPAGTTFAKVVSFGSLGYLLLGLLGVGTDALKKRRTTARA